jgi:hypothetical protein
VILLGVIVLAVYAVSTVAGMAARSRARMIETCGADVLEAIRNNGAR